MPNSADKSPDHEDGDHNDQTNGASAMSDPDLDDLGLAMPEFRVPSKAGVAPIEPAPAATGRLDAGRIDVSPDVTEDDGFADDPTHAMPLGDEISEPTSKIDVDELLEEDANAAPPNDDRFDRAELVKTVRMDAFDRAEVESGGRSWEISSMLDDQRYAPDVLILPPRVLTRKWQDGAVVRANGAAAAARPAPVDAKPVDAKPVEAVDARPEPNDAPTSDEPGGQDRAGIAQTIRTSPLPEKQQSMDAAMELDSEAIVLEDIQDVKPPPPKPAPDGQGDRLRPGRVRRNTGPLQHSEATPSPQSQQEDDDLSGIVQELLEEKKAKAEPKKKVAPKRDEKRINWFNEVFTDEYFRTLPKDFHKQTERDVRFIHQSLGLQKGARLLDLACGFGRHSVELAQRDYEIAGLDVSMAMLQRALAEAQRRGLSIKFVHGDMRELNFNGIFDACFCWQTSFGYFDDRTNVQVAQGVARALKPGGRFLLDVVNRDYVASEMPSRTWWEGHECVFLEEVEFDNHFSVLHTKRSFIYEDGSPPREFSSYIRLYSLHELRQLLHFAGFRVLEVSGGIHHRGSFLGPTSPRIILLAERVVKEG